MTTQSPSSLQSSAWSLLLTVVGLLALLILPFLVRQQAERYHDQFEDRVDPAQRQIDRALEIAYMARSYSDSYQQLLTATPTGHSKSAREHFEELWREWQQETAGEQNIAFSGTEARNYWRAGKADLTRWFDQYGSPSIPSGAIGNTQDDRLKADALFDQGAEEMQRTQMQVDALAAHLREQIVDLSRKEALITLPMGMICLVLAGLAWRNMQSLRRSLEREHAAVARLEVSMKEAHHRIKNNLQVISALVDMQRMEPGDRVPKQALDDLVRQIRAVAAVHDFLSHEMRSEQVPGDHMLSKLVALTTDPNHGLAVQLEADGVALAAKQATAVALITNELLLNSGKHGATEAQVRLQANGQSAHLEVEDNGPGFPEGFDPATDANLGLALIESLVHHDLEGSVTFASEKGAHVEVTFPLKT